MHVHRGNESVSYEHIINAFGGPSMYLLAALHHSASGMFGIFGLTSSFSAGAKDHGAVRLATSIEQH